MKPYYEEDGITIYHGDCADVIESFGLHWGEKPFDLLLTDPPYGIRGKDLESRHDAANGWAQYGVLQWDIVPVDAQLLSACIRMAHRACVWGGNYFSLPPTSGWLVWDKGQREFSLADGELAWTSEQRALRIFSYARGSALRDGKQHPTQKPLALIAWCLGMFPETRTVFDPFLGSGTTLVEAKRRGLQAVGIEREERYCEIAAQRLSQRALDFAVPEVGKEGQA